MMEAHLRKGLVELGLGDDAAPSLLRFGELLLEKNKVMNLTAITDPEDVVSLHFLDSAALLTLADLKDKTVVDVGTGAGFPGMPLKILEPSIRMTLLDSLGKRITFLQEVATSWDCRTCSAFTPGRRNSRQSTGRALTSPCPGPWRISAYCVSCACRW